MWRIGGGAGTELYPEKPLIMMWKKNKWYDKGENFSYFTIVNVTEKRQLELTDHLDQME